LPPNLTNSPAVTVMDAPGDSRADISFIHRIASLN
jgi:hypothetical protein